MNAHSLSTVVLAVLCGGAAGFFAARTMGPVPAPATADDSAALESMLQELRALRTELVPALRAAGEAAPTHRGERPQGPTAPPSAGDQDKLLTELQALRTRVDHIGRLRAAESGALRQLAQTRVRDEHAIRSLTALRDADWDAAQQDVFMLSAADVLQRYGKPDRAHVKGPGVRWEYETGAGDDRVWLGLTLVDGVVVRVE